MADIVADRLNFVDQKPLQLMGELNCLWNRKDRNFEEADDGAGACERSEEPV